MVARQYPALRYLGGIFGMSPCEEGLRVSQTMLGGLLLSFLLSWSWFGVTMKEEVSREIMLL
jgi:hypothetical protein